MKALHDLDGQQVNETLRPDLQRVHEDEPAPQQAIPELPDLNARIRYIFGGQGW